MKTTNPKKKLVVKCAKKEEQTNATKNDGSESHSIRCIPNTRWKAKRCKKYMLAPTVRTSSFDIERSSFCISNKAF